MALQLYMVGLTVRDMGKSQEFYRRLGLDIPDGTHGQPHVEVKMGSELTFFLDSRTITRDDSGKSGQADGYSVVFEYYVKSQAAVEAKYAELMQYGYQSYRAPFTYTNGMRFALVTDPDGNVILLSGDMDDLESGHEAAEVESH